MDIPHHSNHIFKPVRLVDGYIRDRIVAVTGNGLIEYFDLTDWKWTAAEYTMDPIAKAACASHGHHVFIFGGIVSNNSGLGITNKLCVLNSKNNQLEYPSGANSNAPKVRFGATLIYVPEGNYLLLFGGCSMNLQFLNDLHKYDIDNDSWEEIISPDAPTPRESHSAVYWNSKMIVFGGYQATTSRTSNLKHDDLFIYDIADNQWNEIIATGEKPKALGMHSADIHQGKMYIFGGFAANDQEHCSNKLFALDLRISISYR
jgi:N-acetylneuraminic acid mutarotase